MDPVTAFRTYSAQVKGAALVVDPTGTVIFVSPYLDRAIPHADAGYLGAPLEKALSALLTGDASAMEEVLGACREARAWQGPAELHIRLSGGHPGQLRVAPLDYEGQRIGSAVTAFTVDPAGNLLTVPSFVSRRYHSLAEVSSDLIVAFDNQGRIEYANPPLRKLVRRSLAEVVGKRASEVFSERVLQHQEPALRKVLETGQPYHSVLRVLIDGRMRWLDVYLTPLRGDDGTIDQVVEIAHDVTHLKQTEEALEHSEETLRRVLESTDDLVLLTDADGKILYYNGPERYGLSLSDVRGKHASDFFAQDQSDEMVQQIRKVVETGRTMAFETRVTWQGEEEWFSDNRSPVYGHDGSLVAVATISRSITPLKRSEDALRRSELLYRTALDAVQEWMFVLDAELRVLVTNRSLRDALRRGGRREDVTGLPLAEAIPDLPPAMVSSYEELLITGRKQTTVETLRLGDSVLTLETTKAPVFENDQVVQIVTSMHDVTDLKRAEETHRLATLGQVAAGVAHEFNNLLAGMMAKADLAANTSDDDLPEFIKRACAHGAEVCRGLLAFGKPSEPCQEPTYVEQVMEAAISLAAGRLQDTNTVVRRAYQTEGERICADRAQLGQVLLNLIINACDAMSGDGKAGGTLTVGTEPLRKGGSDWVCVTVSDTGSGIAPQHLPRIFEPFFSTKGGPGQGQRGGTGLGLSVSQRIVASHGGTMEVRSSLGSGTTFALCFPALKDAASSARSSGPQGNPRKQADRSAQPPRTILLAEDDEDLVVLFSAILAHEGHNVTMAMTTAEAVERLQRTPFDVVVSDLLLPGGGGREILAEARKLATPPPVIIMTGMNDSGTARELVELGAARFLDKPVSRNALLEAVADVVRNR